MRWALGAVMMSVVVCAADERVVDRIAGLIRANQFAEAIATANQELSAHPKDVQVLTLRGLAEEKSGAPAQALQSFQKALTANGQYVPALTAAVELEYRLKDARVDGDLQKLLALRPSDAVAHAMAGERAWQKGNCKATVSHFRAAGAVAEAEIAALEHYAVCLARTGENAEALRVWERVHARVPEDANAAVVVGGLQVDAGQEQEAMKTLAPFAERGDADALAMMAAAEERSGDTPKAVATLRQAIVKAPDRPEFYVQFASVAMDHASYEVGVDMIDAGLKRMPRGAELYLARGVLLVEMGRYDEADRDFAHAEMLDPGKTAGYGAQALALLQMDRLEEALRAARASVKAHPRDDLSWYVLGEVLAKRGAQPATAEFREAVHAAEEALRWKPDFVAAEDLLSRLYLQAGDTERAIAECRRVLAKNPDDATALYRLLRALKKRGTADDLAEAGELTKRLAAARQRAQTRASEANRYRLTERATP